MFNFKSWTSVLIVLIAQMTIAAQAAEQSSSNDSDVVISDSFDKEIEDSKKQLEESPPEDTVTSPLPPTGKIISSPRDKIEAGREATMILSQGPQNRQKIAAMTASGRPTVALALGGGGARGGAHVGVLRVFQEEGIPVDYIVGNSMGAIVGGLYCAGVSVDDLQEYLANGSLGKAYMPDSLAAKIVLNTLTKLIKPFGNKHYAGIWSGKKFTEYLDQRLPKSGMEISETKIPFTPVAANLLDGRAYRITSGRLSTAIKASSAISPLIQPVALNDKVFIDGGVRANLPASAARDTGAGLVIAVLIDEPLQPVPAKRFTHLRSIAARMADITLATTDERQLQFADIIINPDVSGIPILAKKRSDVEKAVKAGELAARKALPQLRARLKESNPSNENMATAYSAKNQK